MDKESDGRTHATVGLCIATQVAIRYGSRYGFTIRLRIANLFIALPTSVDPIFFFRNTENIADLRMADFDFSSKKPNYSIFLTYKTYRDIFIIVFGRHSERDCVISLTNGVTYLNTMRVVPY